MPTLSSVHVDQALTNFAVALMPDEKIADRITGVVPVNKQSDKYYVVDGAREAFKPVKDQRAPKTRAGSVDFKVSTDNYSCEEHALEAPVSDEERANADTAIQPFLDKTEFVAGRLLLNKELALKTLAAAAVTEDSNRAIAVSNGVWSAATSDLLIDIKAARLRVRNRTTKMPNIGWCDLEVWTTMAHHPEVVERIVYTQAATYEAVARAIGGVLNMEAIYSVNAFQNTSLNDTPVMTQVWDRTKFYMCYRDPRPSLMTQQWITTFQWKGGGYQGYLVDKRRDESILADWVRLRRWYDQKVIDNDCYQEITGVLA